MRVDDAGSWDSIGQSLARGDGFVEDGKPTTVRPPVYPLFLASVYKIFGHSPAAARWIQIVLSALAAVFIFWTARLLFDEKTALCAGLSLGIYPPLVVYSAIIGSETLFIFFLSLFLYILTRARMGSSIKPYILSGVTLGLTNLCRSTLSLYPLFFLALLFPLKGARKETMKILTLAAVSLAVMSPWTIRNYLNFKGFMLVNVSSGQLFWTGTILENKGRYVEDTPYEGYRRFDPFLNDPILWEREMFKAGLENIRKNPLGYAGITFYKIGVFLFEPVGYTITKHKSTFLAALLLLVHAALMILAFYGIFLTFESYERFIPFYALFLYFAMMHSIFAPMPRFRLPIEPFLILFAAVGLLRLRGPAA